MNKKKIISENFDEEKNKESSNVNKNKDTKKKSHAQKIIPILTVIIVSLVVILTCVLIAYYQVYKSGKQSANILEGVYASSYYSMVDNVNNLAVDISKYETLSTTKSKLDTMQKMRTDCTYILAGLTTLPITETNVVSATKFFNQVDGLCASYMKKLSNGNNLTQSEEIVFAEIGQVVGKIKANLNKQNYGMYDTNFNFVDAGIFDNAGMNELSNGMGDISSSNIDYPAMIFDGPFSTALETKTIKGLSETEVTKTDAENYLKNTVYKNREVEIEFLQETSGDIATYDFSVKIKKKQFTAQVSKRGGLLISISGYAVAGDPIMSVEQAGETAKTFANNIGFENMEVVWHEKNENVVYINLVSVQDGVLLYPDMVKVKVDLTSQEIVGFEAQNYAFNHNAREIDFTLTENECEDVLGFDYNVLKTSKCVIRLEDETEVCAYEFVTERIDGDYFYYIDANTKSIVKVLKLVVVKDVEKLI